jgi:propionyl-CoA synthetase
MSYQDLYDRTLSNPDSFWAEAANAVHWDKKWAVVLDDSNAPIYRRFKGARLNTCITRWMFMSKMVAENRQL